MRSCIIKKFHHKGMTFEGLLHNAALHSNPTAVDEPHFVQAGGVRFGHVLLNHGRDVSWREGVQIEQTVDRNPKRVLILHVRNRPAWRIRRLLRS